MAKLIVVVGVTGNQGSSVARNFASLPDWNVRGITRNPSSDTARRIASDHQNSYSKTLDLVRADLDDPASLRAAFAGATAIFAVTDFWQFMRDKGVFTRAADAGKTPNQLAEDLEVQQGKNLADAAAAVLHAEGGKLERFVWSTLSDTKRLSGGKYVHNHHFDGKAAVEAYIRGSLPELATRASYLHVGQYMDNWKGFPGLFAPHKEGNGFVVRVPDIENAYEKPFVHPPNDTGIFVRALVEKVPAGTSLLGVSEMIDTAAAWQVWGEEMGVSVKTEVLREDWVKEHIPKHLGDEVWDSARYTSELGWCGGGKNVKLPSEIGVEVEKLTSWREYIRRTDWKSLL